MLLAGMLLLVAAAMAADDHAGHDHGAHGPEQVRLLALAILGLTPIHFIIFLKIM